jgi:hypothetical protein
MGNLINQNFDNGTILLTKDDFNPELFLSVVQKDASYEKLKVRINYEKTCVYKLIRKDM